MHILWFALLSALFFLHSFAAAQLRSDPINTIPATPWSATAPSQIRTWQLYEDASLRARTMGAFVFSGGLHATSVSLTSAVFATEAFVPERVNQTGVAITYAAVANDYCWVIISSNTVGIAGWTRVGSTAYYYQCEGDASPNEPVLPANSTSLMLVEISGSAITNVIDRRTLHPYLTVTDNTLGGTGLLQDRRNKQYGRSRPGQTSE